MLLFALTLACTAPEAPAWSKPTDPVGDTGESDTSGDTATDTSGDTAADTSGDTAGDTADDTSGDTAGDTSGDTSGDTGTTDTGTTDTGTTDTGTTDTGTTDTSPVTDFALPDLNPGSIRYGETVSPRDYLERVSGWYFVHAT